MLSTMTSKTLAIDWLTTAAWFKDGLIPRQNIGLLFSAAVRHLFDQIKGVHNRDIHGSQFHPCLKASGNIPGVRLCRVQLQAEAAT